MIVSSHAPVHEHGPHDSCHCGEAHSHAPFHLGWSAIGVVLVLNSFLIASLPKADHTIAVFSAACGALILGSPIVWAALKDVRRGLLNTSVLVALAVLALFASGHYQEAGIVSFFMILGQAIELRTAEGAVASIRALVKVTPSMARLLQDGAETEVAAHDLCAGDLVRLRPGDSVPADGVIVSGQGSLNQANITGESLPADKQSGDEVFAGTINLTGVLEVRVTRAGHDTTLGRVRDLILAAESTKLPIARVIDEYMRYYTPLVLCAGGCVWVFTHELTRVISIFIVSCPCAFVLASPTALMAALSAAARLGILIKNVADLETASRIDAFVFDKTGTLTTGVLAVRHLAPIGETTPAELLFLAASAEQFSNHPAAKALVTLAGSAGIALARPSEFSEAAGRGVTAAVDGAAVLAGRPQWLRENGAAVDERSAAASPEAQSSSLIFVARNGRCIGWIALADQARAEARSALASLKDHGVRRVALVSGDRQAVATKVGGELGCDSAVGDCLPEHKVDFVRKTRAKGFRVAVVGDGVNDAPALAAGDLGIAMGAAGSEAAIQSATIALMNNDLRRLAFVLRLSRETRRAINQNFLLGLAFVVGGVVLSALSVVTPVIAAILHVGGSLLVVFNSFRLIRLGEEFEPHEPHQAPAASRRAIAASVPSTACA